MHYFIGFLTSINYMVKWVTSLGRVFKIHDFFRHDFVGFDVDNGHQNPIKPRKNYYIFCNWGNCPSLKFTPWNVQFY